MLKCPGNVHVCKTPATVLTASKQAALSTPVSKETLGYFHIHLMGMLIFVVQLVQCLQQKEAYLASLQVLATSDASVTLRRLKDRQGVISQEVRQHKLALPASHNLLLDMPTASATEQGLRKLESWAFHRGAQQAGTACSPGKHAAVCLCIILRDVMA